MTAICGVAPCLPRRMRRRQVVLFRCGVQGVRLTRRPSRAAEARRQKLRHEISDAPGLQGRFCKTAAGVLVHIQDGLIGPDAADRDAAGIAVEVHSRRASKHPAILRPPEPKVASATPYPQVGSIHGGFAARFAEGFRKRLPLPRCTGVRGMPRCTAIDSPLILTFSFHRGKKESNSTTSLQPWSRHGSR